MKDGDPAKQKPPSTDNHKLVFVLIGVGAGACLTFSIAIIMIIHGYYSRLRKVDKLDRGVMLQ